MGRLIAALAAWVRRQLPQTYVRVEDCALQGWFVCDLAEAADIVAEELRRLQADPLHWTWRDDTLLVGELRITFVRMSPRRFEALPEFMGTEMQLTITVRHPPAEMPDADTDVLIWDSSHPEAQLGAYVGPELSDTGWVDAHGECVPVIAWASLPLLGDTPAAPATLTTKAGECIDLGAALKVPA